MVDEIIKILKSDSGEKITKAAKTLSEKAKEVVELPKNKIKDTLQLLMDALEKPHVDDGEIYHSLLTITNEMILKFDNVIPEEQAISYEWFISWFDDK